MQRCISMHFLFGLLTATCASAQETIEARPAGGDSSTARAFTFQLPAAGGAVLSRLSIATFEKRGFRNNGRSWLSTEETVTLSDDFTWDYNRSGGAGALHLSGTRADAHPVTGRASQYVKSVQLDRQGNIVSGSETFSPADGRVPWLGYGNPHGLYVSGFLNFRRVIASNDVQYGNYQATGGPKWEYQSSDGKLHYGYYGDHVFTSSGIALLTGRWGWWDPFGGFVPETFPGPTAYGATNFQSYIRGEFSYSFGNEYTDDMFLEDVALELFTYATPFDRVAKSAELTFSPDNFTISVARLQYKIEIPAGFVGDKIQWLEEFTPADENAPEEYTPKFWDITSGATETPAYEINPLAMPLRRSGTWEVVLFDARLVVDANRDGKIDPEDPLDQTSADLPFRFWLNDDVDRHHQVDASGSFGGYDVQDDLKPASYAGNLDWNLNTVPGTRDLEDWARLWVNIGGLQDRIASGQIRIGLKWKDVTGTPAIKLLRANEADGGGTYLTSTTVASAQVTGSYGSALVDAASQSGTAALIQSTNADWDFLIPTAALGDFSASNPSAHFLFEGCQYGKGELTIVLLKPDGGSFTKVGDGPGVWLDLKNIKEMYERWTVGDGSEASWLTGAGGGGSPTNAAIISQDRLPAEAVAGQYTSQSPEKNQYILHVHGWNMVPWEKDAFAETAFKRLYWRGYQGRFGTFQWPTTYHDHDFSAITDYDEGEYTAWLSATPLKDLLVLLHQQYGADVYVFAHSMGNVVTGEALRLAATMGAGQLVNTYVASQAAVPGQCYDAAVTAGSPLGFGLLGIFGPTTPNIYDNWLTPNSGAAGTRANFFNINDYALGKWQLGQKLKPDSAAGLWKGTPPNDIGPPYGYTGNTAAAPVQNGFFKTTFGPDPNGSGNHVQSGTLSLSLEDRNSGGNVTNLHDRYEIMAFASEPRSLALGGVASVSGLSPQSLPEIWPSDTLTDDPSKKYKDHPWHSAQFRFDNMDQSNYWKALLGPNGFDLQSP